MHPILSRLLFVPTFSWNYVLGRILRVRHWWDYVDPHVILGAMPMRSDIKPLFDLGVRAVINMCKEYPGPKDLYETYGIRQLWLPTVDFNPPSLEDVQRGVQYLQDFTSRNETVYVHCKAGRARSATIVICWLVKHRGMTLAQAQEHLLKSRRHVLAKLGDREVVKQYLQIP
ncbi:MAG: dual specificity protein phosphatase family protein [Pirellula sp.]